MTITFNLARHTAVINKYLKFPQRLWRCIICEVSPPVVLCCETLFCFIESTFMFTLGERQPDCDCSDGNFDPFDNVISFLSASVVSID